VGSEPGQELFEQDLEIGPLVARHTWSDASRAPYGALKIEIGKLNFPAIRASPHEPD